jgi:hypothetical protein
MLIIDKQMLSHHMGHKWMKNILMDGYDLFNVSNGCELCGMDETNPTK